MARAKIIRTYTKGAYVRYIGNDERRAEIWGETTYKVMHKSGDCVIGMFPYIGCDGKKHLDQYSVPIKDLAIVY